MRRGDVVQLDPGLTGDGMLVHVWFRSDGPRKRVWVVCPPYIFRPTTRLAYCTGILRTPSVMSTTSTTTASMHASRMITWKAFSCWVWNTWLAMLMMS